MWLISLVEGTDALAIASLPSRLRADQLVRALARNDEPASVQGHQPTPSKAPNASLYNITVIDSTLGRIVERWLRRSLLYCFWTAKASRFFAEITGQSAIAELVKDR